MKVIFLGTTGWYDTETGNTPCALIDAKNCYVVFDAGFGISKLDKYIKEAKPIYLFISHAHLDHICGLHVLNKFKFKSSLTIIVEKQTRPFVEQLIRHPYTASREEWPYESKVMEIGEGSYNEPLKFTSRRLKHIDPTLGYRLELDGKVISHCSDTAVCPNDLLLAKGADLLIHESAFMKKSESGWGHSCPEEAAQIAKEAGAKKLALVHFGADCYQTMRSRETAQKNARKIFKNTVAAKDGTVVKF